MTRLGARMRKGAGGWSARPRTADESGSVMLLTIGYAVLALAVVLICVDATSLYLAQKRVDAVADAAALAAADGFELQVRGGGAVAVLDDDGVRAQADAVVAAIGSDVTVVSASTPDAQSARVTVAATWRPPVMTVFVPEGLVLEGTATSRTALR